MAYFNQTGEGSSPMDKVKKILSSPMARKKIQQPVQPKYFGVPLEEILQREGTDVPHLITKICTFLLKNGVTNEGIFRVNGNAKIIEKIKQSFETSGDANLDNAGDVMAVAAVLKLFLRQLPEGLVPEAETLEFVRIQEAYKSNKEVCQHHVRNELSKLSRASYSSLQYLCNFLVEVTRQEASNKMNPMALGIVFGPNIFRCSLGVQGLKEQGITNHITLNFIRDYNALFLQDTSPKIMQNGRKKPAPPRPPPPKVDENNEVSQPVITPRKNKQKYDSSTYHDSDTGSIQSSDTRTTPRYSDEEFLETGRLSPFPLETDRSEYSAHTSFINNSNTEAVEKAISSAITEHLFGDGNGSLSSEEAPVRPPRRKVKSRYDNIEESFESTIPIEGSEEAPVNIKQRIQQFEGDQKDNKMEVTGPVSRKQPQSKAFQMFEEKGLVIGLAPSNVNMQTLKYGGDGAEVPVESDDNSQPSVEEPPKPAPRVNKRSQHNGEVGFAGSKTKTPTSFQDEDSGFNGVPRAQGTLSSFKKPAGPRNRRNPTRKSLKGEIMEENSNTEESPVPPPRPRGFLLENNNENDLTTSDVNHNNAAKPSTSFLDIHFNGAGDRNISPDKSPSAEKPFVPPLDLSILHEHGDGSEPIPVNQGLSISLHKVQPDSTEDKAIISPRSDKIKKTSLQHDPEIPPSPPMEQTKKRVHRVEDEFSAQVKMLTKKIQTCKRKIKNFEEAFELDHGYRPSQTDKAARPEIKKYMQDLARTRKELRKIKEEQEQQRLMTSPGTGGSSAGEDGPPTMKETLHVLMKRLVEKRKDGNRPEDLMLMSADQIQEEKLAVQKALLHFESLHGRPATKTEKELMRPLYDRYRNIKRLLAKSPFSQPSDKSKDSLQTVPEDHALEFEAQSAKSTFSNRDPIRIPTAEPEEIAEEKDTFLVTKDFHLMGETVKPPQATTSKGTGLAGISGGGSHHPSEPLKENVLHSPVKEMNKNLHEMTYTQLLEEQTRVKNEKKRLRKILREFEDDFYEQNGEKVQKEDRAPMDVEYREYKHIKARLKLLEALLSKHGINSDL